MRRHKVLIGSRPTGTQVLSVRLPDDLAEELLGVVSERRTTISAVVREVIGRYLADRRRVAWLDAHRDELEVVPGSGRLVRPRGIPSLLSGMPGGYGGGRTFRCAHLSVGGVIAASCGQCGPLTPDA